MDAGTKQKLGIALIAAVVFLIGIVLFTRGKLNKVISAVPGGAAPSVGG